MDYYLSGQLPVLTFDRNPGTVDLQTVCRALCERPFNLVLIREREKLIGVISQGDMIRAVDAGASRVPVNCGFTFLIGKRFMQAREIFQEKAAIREIPVVDASGRLAGLCTRSDDLLYLEYSSPWETNRYVRPFLESLKAARFVRVPGTDARRQHMISRWISEFEKCGVACEQIDVSQIAEKQEDGTPILLVDEEMSLGVHAVLDVLGRTPFRPDVIRTFRAFEKEMSEHAYDELLRELSASGIRVYNLFFSRDESTEERRRLFEGMRRWRELPEASGSAPFVVPACAQGFYGELNVGNYASQVGKPYYSLESGRVYIRMKDVSSPYLNIVNGERVTVGQPERADRTIWFFGPCVVIGGFVEDRHTIESFLQERLNRDGYSCRVVNCGCYETPYQRMVRVTSAPIRPGDIVVLYVRNHPVAGTVSVDLTELLAENSVPSEWLLDIPLHCNHKVNRIYAEELYRLMVRDGVLLQSAGQDAGGAVLSRSLAIHSLFLDLHFHNFHPKEGEVVGSIGMHGNPFTLGHRYLIETASGMVDRLFVLLIEDEIGSFSYAERFAMAVEGTRDLPNVRIVAGGPFQATRNVFREYFVRIEPADMRESAMTDTLIFAESIAPRLGITRRFLGDERNNPKMQFFNDLLKETLPAYGIEVIELPRAESGGHPISASLARKAAAEGDMETLLANIPETTARFLLGGEDPEP